MYVPIHLTSPTGTNTFTPFAEGLVHFGAVQIAVQSLSTLCDTKILANVTLVPGTHLYRHRKYTGSESLDVDHLWTALTDDYRVLREDGSFTLKELTPWL